MFFQSEKSLIQKAKCGDKRAWFKLIKQFEKPIYHYCLRMLGDPDDAVDLLQETFMSIYKSLDSFRFDSSFKTWAIRIAHFRCVEFYRKRKVCQPLDKAPEIYSDDSSPELHLFNYQSGEQVINALSILPWEQRSVVELKFFQHFTFEQIATQLDVSQNTVKSRLYSALKKLKSQLEVDHG